MPGGQHLPFPSTYAGQQPVAILPAQPCDGPVLPCGNIGSDGRIRLHFLHRRRMAGNDRHERFLVGSQRPCPVAFQRHDMGGDGIVMEPPNIGQRNAVDDLGRQRVGYMRTGAFPALRLIQNPCGRAAMSIRLPGVGFEMDELINHKAAPGAYSPRQCFAVAKPDSRCSDRLQLLHSHRLSEGPAGSLRTQPESVPASVSWRAYRPASTSRFHACRLVARGSANLYWMHAHPSIFPCSSNRPYAHRTCASPFTIRVKEGNANDAALFWGRNGKYVDRYEGLNDIKRRNLHEPRGKGI